VTLIKSLVKSVSLLSQGLLMKCLVFLHTILVTQLQP